MTRPDVLAVLAAEMEQHDHAPDLELAGRIVRDSVAESHLRGGTITVEEMAAFEALGWLRQDAVVIGAIRRGEHLPNERLVELLTRNARLPRDVRAHIADCLAGKRRRGRPTPKYDPAHREERDRLAFFGEMVCDLYKQNRAAGMRSGPGQAGAYVAARRAVAEWTGIPEDTLDKHARPRLKATPR